MTERSIDGIIDKIYKKVESHKLGEGDYSLRTGGESDAYGCADAVNILYTLGNMPKTPEAREAHIKAIRAHQDRESGLFISEGAHHRIHTTAQCIGALELLDATPDYPLTELEKYTDINEVFSMLDKIDWLHCGRGAHPGAGIYASLVNTRRVDAAWRREYFRRLTAACDPECGLWRRLPTEERFTKRLQIGDAFHYLFNYAHEREPFPYPEALIDTCLEAYRTGEMEAKFGRQFHYIEMDWVYCLSRASRQTSHRFYEVKAAIEEFAEGYLDYLENTDWEEEYWADDLHLVFGVTCALAELQGTLSGKIRSEIPLRLVLDRRPFI